VREHIEAWSDVPKYVQLAAILRAQIERGELSPGMPLPSAPHLMATYEVSRGTVRKALEILRNEGLIETFRQIGSRVKPDA
jgi:DNA-binding GntR family transcriptional regulator